MTSRMILMIFTLAIVTRIALPTVLPNFSAIDAIALFCGAYCSRKIGAIFIVLFSVWLGDVIINHSLSYPGWYWQYGCYALITCLGSFLNHRVKPLPVLLAGITSASLFFIVSNFGVWCSGLLYPMTREGFMACYIAAIPFFKNTLVSDLIFTALLFACTSFVLGKDGYGHARGHE